MLAAIYGDPPPKEKILQTIFRKRFLEGDDVHHAGSGRVPIGPKQRVAFY
jgi:hypothetical protein